MQRIYKYPAEVLKRVAKPVRTIDGTLVALLDEMAKTMYAAPGVGLAAPQVGLSERAIVLDCDSAEERAEGNGRGLLRLINPEIVEAEGTILWEEGCLSVVDFTAEVKRAAHVLVREEWIDAEFIDAHVAGFAEFAEMVRDCTPEWAERITGVPADATEELAAALHGSAPASIVAGFGMQRYTNSGQAMRAMIALLAITGQIGKPGAGWVYANLQTQVFGARDRVLAKRGAGQHGVALGQQRAQFLIREADLPFERVQHAAARKQFIKPIRRYGVGDQCGKVVSPRQTHPLRAYYTAAPGNLKVNIHTTFPGRK
jgi:peptide deformylase